MIKISIIIPVYNIAEFIKECVDSVQSQNFDGFEIILVDDGSTDGSGALCDSLAKSDTRITVIHQPNGGVTSAREAGISIAKGEYLYFVDGDDLLPAGSLEALWCGVSESDADIIVGCKQRLNVNGSLGKVIDETFPDTFSPAEYLSNIGKWHLSLHSRVFRRTLFSSDIKVAHRIVYSEDRLMFIQLVSVCQKIACVDRIVYIYRNRPSSVMNTLKHYPPERYIFAAIGHLDLLERFELPAGAQASISSYMMSMLYDYYRLTPDFKSYKTEISRMYHRFRHYSQKELGLSTFKHFIISVMGYAPKLGKCLSKLRN